MNPIKIYNGKNGFSLVNLIVIICIIGVISAIAIPDLMRCKISSNEGAAAGSLKTLNGMMSTYKKKGYAGFGKRYPIGNDYSVFNNGKFCGLYYEVNNANETVTLIGAAEAGADARADGNPDSAECTGWYLPCTFINTYNLYTQPIQFSLRPKQGYWFALMRNLEIKDGGLMPYDYENARHHYGLSAWPSEYGHSGECTYIINEEGTVYALDRGEAGYVENYPTVTPADQYWEIAQ